MNEWMNGKWGRRKKICIFFSRRGKNFFVPFFFIFNLWTDLDEITLVWVLNDVTKMNINIRLLSLSLGCWDIFFGFDARVEWYELSRRTNETNWTEWDLSFFFVFFNSSEIFYSEDTEISRSRRGVLELEVFFYFHLVIDTFMSYIE